MQPKQANHQLKLNHKQIKPKQANHQQQLEMQLLVLVKQQFLLQANIQLQMKPKLNTQVNMQHNHQQPMNMLAQVNRTQIKLFTRLFTKIQLEMLAQVNMQHNHQQPKIQLEILSIEIHQPKIQLKMKPNIRIEIHTFLIADQLYYHSIIEGPIWIQIQLLMTKPQFKL